MSQHENKSGIKKVGLSLSSRKRSQSLPKQAIRSSQMLSARLLPRLKKPKLPVLVERAANDSFSEPSAEAALKETSDVASVLNDRSSSELAM